MEYFIMEVKRTTIHCKKMIDQLHEKKEKYDILAKVGTL